MASIVLFFFAEHVLYLLLGLSFIFGYLSMNLATHSSTHRAADCNAGLRSSAEFTVATEDPADLRFEHIRSLIFPCILVPHI